MKVAEGDGGGEAEEEKRDGRRGGEPTCQSKKGTCPAVAYRPGALNLAIAVGLGDWPLGFLSAGLLAPYTLVLYSLGL